mmetsp:Transcript_72508/g.143769  ORF Transcript_72508/g.143769 Transcript_72508/m.143769 type:complete len:251 (-) Transcript_72508:3755-4507(-)
MRGLGEASSTVSIEDFFTESIELRLAFGMTEPGQGDSATWCASTDPSVASTSQTSARGAQLFLPGVFIMLANDTRRDAPPKFVKGSFSVLSFVTEFASHCGSIPSGFCKSNAISLASCASPASMVFKSSLKSRSISRRQCRNCRRKGECLSSMRFFSWMSTGTMFSHMFRFKILLRTPRAASALALSPVPSASPSSSWPAFCVVKHMRISLQHKSASPSLSACPAGSSVVMGRSIFSSASTKAARRVVTI